MIIEKRIKVDNVSRLSNFRPEESTTPHADLCADLGCRRKCSTKEQVL